MADGKVNVLYEDNHIIVVEKIRNVLVQEDNTKDEDMLTIIKKYLKEKYNKPGNVYLGLVHRLDRPVGGVMVFAKTSKAAGRLTDSITNHKFKKTYLAVLCGKLEGKGILEDYLKKNEKLNMTEVSEYGKYAKLEYEAIDYKESKTLVKINLVTGRSHQIRVQFASRNLPLWGDQKYNKKAIVGEQIALWAYKLAFEHPVTKEILSFNLKPKDEYPWNLFGGEDSAGYRDI